VGDFDGIESAETSGRLPNIVPGRYVFEIQALKMIRSRTKGSMFIAEFRVAEALGTNANEVGSLCSWIVKMSLDNAKGNIKGFVAALLNEPNTNVTSAMCEDLVAPDQIARGRKIRGDASVIKTKAGNDFTLVMFSPFESAPVEAPVPAAVPSSKKK
jgi:hypothetical protein